MKRLSAMAGLLFMLVVPVWGNAMNDITTADAIAIREAVEAQLRALSNDDAPSAFELATLEKRMQIGSPDNFLRIIKEQYHPIYHYQSLMFSRAEVVEGSPIQIVRLADADGKVWVAVFWMQQEEGSAWKIDGCQLFETSSVST